MSALLQLMATPSYQLFRPKTCILFTPSFQAISKSFKIYPKVQPLLTMFTATNLEKTTIVFCLNSCTCHPASLLALPPPWTLDMLCTTVKGILLKITAWVYLFIIVNMLQANFVFYFSEEIRNFSSSNLLCCQREKN